MFPPWDPVTEQGICCEAVLGMETGRLLEIHCFQCMIHTFMRAKVSCLAMNINGITTGMGPYKNSFLTTTHHLLPDVLNIFCLADHGRIDAASLVIAPEANLNLTVSCHV